MDKVLCKEIQNAFAAGAVIPYLGPGILSVGEIPEIIPKSPLELVVQLNARSPVPGKLRKNLTGAAQFIENFKHRHTLRKAMAASFSTSGAGNVVHQFIASQVQLPLVVHAWYDQIMRDTMAQREDWYLVQAASRADFRNIWYRCFSSSGEMVPDAIAGSQQCTHTLLYEPLGANWPEGNCLVSDSDFVEVLTEIDIQTPIPTAVQEIRKGRSFLFMGCRFDNQLDRQFARQIMKRSSQRHWAALDEEPTKNELRFLEEQSIQRLPVGIEELITGLKE